MNGSTDPWEVEPAPAARFTIVPGFILDTLRGNELLVYVALASFADERGYSWPSFATLAERTGLSRSTVIRTLDTLMGRDGFRKVARKGLDGGQSSNGYFIPVHRPN